jgi:hypothetical protein
MAETRKGGHGRKTGRETSARAAERPLGGANQGTQGRVDGSFVAEILSHVGREQHEIGSCPVARGVFAANAALQFREVVPAAQVIATLWFLSLLLHVFAGARW